MITKRKLSGGGDIKFDEMMSVASSVGVDLVELLYIPRNKLPHFGSPTIAGYQVPIVNTSVVSFDSESDGGARWIDGTVKFFPDENGYCYGYVYYTSVNKDLMASSLSSNWFRIVDKNIRDEVYKLAQEKGYRTEPVPFTELKIIKSEKEVEASKEVEKAQRKIAELEAQLKLATARANIAKQEHAGTVKERLKGIVSPANKVKFEPEENK